MIYLLSSYLFLGLFVKFSKSYVTCVDLKLTIASWVSLLFMFFCQVKLCMEIYVCPYKFLCCIQIFCPACLIPSEINSPHAHDPANPTHRPAKWYNHSHVEIQPMSGLGGPAGNTPTHWWRFSCGMITPVAKRSLTIGVSAVESEKEEKEESPPD
jgi:hypothetical protein